MPALTLLEGRASTSCSIPLLHRSFTGATVKVAAGAYANDGDKPQETNARLRLKV